LNQLTKIIADLSTARPPVSVPQRSATVEYNSWQRYPWMLRCYGVGIDTIAREMPSHFADKLRAEQVAKCWIATGVSPANQVPA
jgi:hypothetical protein